MSDKENIESYIKNRLEQYQNWYDSKAVTMKKLYLSGKIISSICAVLIPIISNIPLSITLKNSEYDVSNVLVTILGVIVAAIIALEGVLHYREQWKNYRTTEQYLQTQKNLFKHSVGDYENLEKDHAFKLLVSRVEKAIEEENAITLNVLTKNEKDK
ncbi:DUF4231 domain-containing protein [Lentimicrobium sp. S6]|uniref:DUF4231 domain-containing protein n=1 Tax=Lentimicrobium sp. S6 TaxID=2735872 RepID=UPI0015571801|nr:DUF4231 domain-containing protein [Lentimicrobium sp. S6]NPD44254.1 DUF4231 domain-containing protein [Lentimicrobium sp. S6]